MDNKKIARQILADIGGRNNIASLTNCYTRLRFVLKDRSKADKEKISQLEGVIQVVEASGQFQVVLGNNVTKVYQEMEPLIKSGTPSEEAVATQEKVGIGTRILNTIAAIFTPTIPAIAASGMLKGVLAVAALLGTSFYQVDIKNFNTYIILNAASDALFYFMPIILARSAAKVFKTNDYIAMIVGATLCYPAIVDLMTAKSSVTLFGLGITKANYTSSVIPIIIAVFILSYLERFIAKIMPEVLKIIMVPTLCLLIMVPATLFVFGPVGIYLGNFVNWLYYYIMNFSPVLLGAFIGGIWCVLVIFGAHRAIIPIGINDVATTGRQNLLAFAGAANFSQAGAALGVFLKTRNKNLKTVSASATVTALFGITEPAIYGANLRLKRPMVCAVISGTLGGALMGWGGSFGNAFANQGVLTIPVYADAGIKGFVCYLLGCAIAFFGGCILTMISGFEDLPETAESAVSDIETADSSAKEMIVSAPLSGRVVALDQVEDEVFSSGAMGKGVAVYPTDNKVVAPMSCTVQALYPTLHAIGLLLDNGVELLIHIGKDTVELNSRHFKKHTEIGSHLEKGELIVSFDQEAIRQEGYDLTTPLIVTNSDQYSEITVVNRTQVKENEDLLLIK